VCERTYKEMKSESQKISTIEISLVLYVLLIRQDSIRNKQQYKIYHAVPDFTLKTFFLRRIKYCYCGLSIKEVSWHCSYDAT